MTEIKYEIKEELGVLSESNKGWTKELNLISWNEGEAKYDIRDWDLDHEHMSRGITLTEKEMRQIFDLMKRRRMNHREGQTQGEDPKPDPPAKKGKEPER